MSEQEFIQDLYEQEPNLKTEGLGNFNGYFVHWDKIVEACGNKTYDQSPLELITDLINERDDLIQKLTVATNGELERSISPHAQKIIEKLERDRDAWKNECQMYRDAWQRELGGAVYNKTHFIDALVVTTRALKKKLTAFEEVAKKDFR